MMDTNVDTKLTMAEYVSVVDSLVKSAFDVDGAYNPFYFRMNAMRLFYDLCVSEGAIDFPYGEVDIMKLEPLVTNEEFLNLFDGVFQECFFGVAHRLEFVSAYNDALEIIESKRGSVGQVIAALNNIAADFTNKIGSILSDENISKLNGIAEMIGKGDFSADTISAAVLNSLGA